MDEQVQMSVDQESIQQPADQEPTQQPAPISIDQPALQSSPLKWLPFGLTWNVAWKWSTVVMPILCVLSFLGLGFGIYVGFSGVQVHPLIFATWLLINIALWLVVVVHAIVDVLVVREWENGNWENAFNNGYIIFLLITNAVSLLIGGLLLSAPSVYGGSSFFLLVSLGTLTFMDIWVLNHMKEKKVVETTL